MLGTEGSDARLAAPSVLGGISLPRYPVLVWVAGRVRLVEGSTSDSGGNGRHINRLSIRWHRERRNGVIGTSENLRR